MNSKKSNLIGRLALYTLTIFMISFPLVLVTSSILIIKPSLECNSFLEVYRILIAFNVGSFFALFIILFVLYPLLIPEREFLFHPVSNVKVHVGLTAYNDEICIGEAVREFKNCSQIDKVIVVDNNSQDNTSEVAWQNGADQVVKEMTPGYGSCCMRALAECAIGLDDNDVIVLCEGDMTFSAYDIPKFLSYIQNCDLVLGTRATQELRASKTQMDWLINPANQVVAKMIQTRFWGTRLTDVGCTYRAIRVNAYRKLKEYLKVQGNHFSPHMFIEALKLQMRVIEIPIVFKARLGDSKGVGSNKIKAAQVAIRMLQLLYTA